MDLLNYLFVSKFWRLGLLPQNCVAGSNHFTELLDVVADEFEHHVAEVLMTHEHRRYRGNLRRDCCTLNFVVISLLPPSSTLMQASM